jgi:hypothetical protein
MLSRADRRQQASIATQLEQEHSHADAFDQDLVVLALIVLVMAAEFGPSLFD